MKKLTILLLSTFISFNFLLGQIVFDSTSYSSINLNTNWDAKFNKGTINMGHYGWWQDFFETPDDYSNAYYNGKYYVLMSFNRNPDAAAIARLNSVGIRLLKYVPSQTYWVEISENTTYDDIPNNVNTNDFSVLQIASFPIDWKVNSTLDIYGSNNDSINIKHKIMVWIHNGVSLLQVKNEIEADSIIVTDTMGEINAIVLYTNGAHFIELKNSPIVYYIEPLDNRIEAQASTSFINNFSNASYSNLGTSGLSGLGVQINLYEDYINPHIDFRKRITSYVPTSSIFSHGTEMAGNIVGKGIIDPRAKGVAFNGNLNIISTNNAMVTYSTMPGFNLTGWNNFYNGTINAKISSNSWVSIVGNPCGLGSPYNAYSYTFDHTSILRQNLLQIFAAGNNPGILGCNANTFRSITSSLCSSKNSLTIGALSANNLIASYSAYGPVSDGRIKPDLVTLGDVSINTDLIDGYSFGNVGTSQATSIASGCAALVYERYKQIYNSWPSSTLVKGLLMNSATDVDNLGPDYRTGYGNINMYKTLQNLNQSSFISGSIVNGQTKTYTFNPGSNGITSKIMLIWQDIEGTPSATIALINDLDLQVNSSTSVVTQPSILDPSNPSALAITGIDHLNNVEQVTLNNTNSTYTISVSGFNIPNGATQEFFLLFTNNDFGLKLIYPNGGNILSPGSIEKITWEAYSMPSSGLFSIDYSIDGGVNWTPIVTNLSSVTRTINWTIPATFTNQGRIRVRQTSPYSLSEISDNNFNILGQPSGLTITNQCENKFTLNWTSTANATDYIVERLDESTDTWTTIQTTTTNSTTITEPNLGCYYYTIQARRTSLNIISEFAIAKKVCLTHNASVSGTFLLSPSPSGCLIPGTTNIYINASLAVPINYNIWWEVSIDNGLSWNATTITQTGSGTWLIPVFLTNMGGWQYRLNYINYANCTRYVSNTLSLDLDFNFTSYTSMDLSGVGNNTQGSHTVTLNQSLGLQYQWQFRSYKGEYVCYTDPNTGVQYYCPEYDNWEDINCTLMYINSCTETKMTKTYNISGIPLIGDLRFNFTGYNSPTLTHLYLDPAIGGNYSNDAMVAMFPHQIRCKVFNNSCLKYSNEDGFGLTKTNKNQGISNEISNSIFKVYPNPIINNFTIETVSLYPVKFYIFSAEGKGIFSGIFSNNYNLNVADWVNGYYFIKFVTGSTVQTQKLIINH